MTAPRTVVITGASAGIGRAAARRSAPAATSRPAGPRRGRAGRRGKDVEDAGGHAMAIPTDVADSRRSKRPPRRSRTSSGPSTSG